MLNSKSLLIAASVAVGGGVSATSTKAAFIFNLQQVGGNVVVTGAGTVNTAGLSRVNTGGGVGSLDPRDADVAGGPTTNSFQDVYVSITGPASFGSGTGALATSGNGDAVGIIGAAGGGLFLPTGYVSGTPLADTDTYANQTFATLGFTPGTYTYTFGTGATADSVVVTSAALPEPTTPILLAVTGLALLRRRRAAGV